MVTAHFSKPHKPCSTRIGGATIRLFYNPMGATLINHSYVTATMMFFRERSHSDRHVAIPNQIFDLLSQEVKAPAFHNYGLLLRRELSQ